VTDETKAEMRKILDEIQTGEFAREWMAEYRAGAPNLLAARAAVSEHPVERVGRELRPLMPFLVDKVPADDV
jgi:ketol-acid reductoisomerase